MAIRMPNLRSVPPCIEHWKGNDCMTESEAVEGHAFRAERTYDEVVLRFPSLNRLVRAFLPAEAAKHLYAAQREQLLAVRSIVDAMISHVEVAGREDGAGAPRRTEINVD
jgi:hypothetical protein